MVFEPGDPWMDLPVLRTVTEEDMWALSANQPTWKCGKYGQLVPQKMSAHPLLLDSGHAPEIDFSPPGKTHTDLLSSLSIAEDHLRGFPLCAVHLQGSTSPGLLTTVPLPHAALSLGG